MERWLLVVPIASGSLGLGCDGGAVSGDPEGDVTADVATDAGDARGSDAMGSDGMMGEGGM
ncbi:MAG: hypothetical protein HY905_22045 [Deltaproteobacteria bacterium]|nr:hypothetical protein [Deltaproteobacteria bacterium]